MNIPLFDLQGVCFAYDAAQPILHDIHFQVFPGERVALEGANGSGKTTLFHLMVGLHQPTSGTISAFGSLRRSEKDFRPVRAQAGLLFQDSDDQLFCPTVAEDVAFGPLNLGQSPAQARQTTRETLELLGLQALEHRVTHHLSGGQKRLVALATILAMQPQVLLLDEPTNGLDQPSSDRLTEILAGLPQAMVIISHDAAFLDALATRRVRLDAGMLSSPL